MNTFVCEKLGLNNITGVTSSFKNLVEDTNPDVPILFVTFKIYIFFIFLNFFFFFLFKNVLNV